MGGNRADKRYLTEIWLPQLSLSIDAEISADTLIREAGKEALKRFKVDHSAFTVISAINERDLQLEKTMEDEGIRRGDRLILLFEAL